MKLVGIHGRATAGKDTAGAVFIKAGYRRLSFADALKECVAVIAGESSENFFSMEGKEGVSPVLNTTRRVALQNVGNAMRETLDDEIWIRRAMAGWDQAGRPPTVITDVRYPNEAAAIRGMGGTIIQILRPGASGLVGEAANHVSEVPLNYDLIDIDVHNDGTVGELNHEISKIVAMLADGDWRDCNPFRKTT